MINEFFTWPNHLPYSIENLSLTIVLILAVICSLIIAISNNLVNIIVLSTNLSLLMSMVYLLLNAPDVSITEASMGACITSVVLLLSLTYIDNPVLKNKHNIKALLVCSSCALAFIYGCSDLPLYGDVNSPANGDLYKYYIQNSGLEIGVYATSAAILANYRGYDTLAETAVIFTAAINLLMILGKFNKINKVDSVE